MSRVGATPILLPVGVKIGLAAGEVDVKGPKGELKIPFDDGLLDVKIEQEILLVSRKSEEQNIRALHGLIRSLIANAVTGVTQGFSKRLDVFGVGYRAELQGGRLTLHVGFSHPVVYDSPAGIEIALGPPQGGAQARIVVSGIDKQQVGQVAADIRFKRKPEPYKGKGIRYENEVIHSKAGKAAV